MLEHDSAFVGLQYAAPVERPLRLRVQFARLIVGLKFLRLVLKKAALRFVILFRNIHESFPFFGKLVASWGNLTKRRVGISKLKRKTVGKSATRLIADTLP